MRFAQFTYFVGLILLICSAPVHAAGLLELGKTPPKETIVPIGTVPEKKIIPLNLGSLRTEGAKLPPAPLTRSERMALRAKRGVTRQRQVSNARRQRVAQRQQPTQFHEEEGFAVDGDGEPIME